METYLDDTDDLDCSCRGSCSCGAWDWMRPPREYRVHPVDARNRGAQSSSSPEYVAEAQLLVSPCSVRAVFEHEHA